jgi:hypothetical protein
MLLVWSFTPPCIYGTSEAVRFGCNERRPYPAAMGKRPDLPQAVAAHAAPHRVAFPFWQGALCTRGQAISIQESRLDYRDVA